MLKRHFAILALTLSACGLNTAKLPASVVIANSGDTINAGGRVSYAIVGATRTANQVLESDTTVALINDIRTEVPMRGIGGVIFTGDYTSRSSTEQWTAFAERWGDLVNTSHRSSDNRARKPAIGLVGANERKSDLALKGYATTFQGFPAEIGHNRYSSWSMLDITSNGEEWRVLFLDTDKESLGSRWKEQLFWVPTVVEGDQFDHLIVFMSEPYLTLNMGIEMNRGGHPRELLETIDMHVGVQKLRAVVSGGAATNEFFLPAGIYGEGYLVAGNGDIASPGMKRWAKGQQLIDGDLGHEAIFGLALLDEFQIWANDLSWPEKLLDQARGEGAWDGFVAELPGNVYPTSGWWEMEIVGGTVGFSYRQRRHDGTFIDLFKASSDKDTGWSTRKP